MNKYGIIYESGWKPPKIQYYENDYVNHDIYSCEGIECNH